MTTTTGAMVEGRVVEPGGSVLGGDAWRGQAAQWQCYATEAPVGQEVGYEGDYTVARSPDEVLDWLRDRLELISDSVRDEKLRREVQERLADRAWWNITLAALTWGRTVGAIVGTSENMVTHLSARAVRP